MKELLQKRPAHSHSLLPFCFVLFALGLFPLTTSAQITGGQHVFKMMSLSPSARITGMGGLQIAVKDDDPVFAATNPAALNAAMSGHLTFQHNFFLSDIQHGYVSYAQHLSKIGFTVHGGIQYLNYGDFKRADEFGNVQGQFKVSETALLVGGARQLTDRISLGLNLRLGLSTLDTYHASALAADLGVMYADTAHGIVLALVLRNYGAELSTYNDQREDLPNDVQLGFSKRLRHLPFRFSIIAHHLHQWDIRYDDPATQQNEVDLFGGDAANTGGNPGVDNFFRHFVFNGEFLFGRTEAFRVRFGYNHLLKQELSVDNYRSLAGFSGGIGIKISRFRLDAGYGGYHLAGGVFHVGIGTNLKDFF